jgi:hypothetical protein
MVKVLALTALVFASSLTFAQSQKPNGHDIKSIEVYELPLLDDHAKVDMAMNGMGPGEIIGLVNDLIALGEKIYPLVQKGKPTIAVDYAPINVVPRDPITKQYVDPFDLTNTSDPVKKRFVASIKNFFGAEAVRFEYMVVFSYGGSWNGKGKYIQNAMIIPVGVTASYGYDFVASMKLQGITNKGTAADPIATALLTMNYTIQGWGKSVNNTQVVHVTGLGEIQVQ